MRLSYRLRVDGREHLPSTGCALLISNHLSLLDAFILGAAVQRPVRFFLPARSASPQFVERVFRWLADVSLARDPSPPETIRSLRAAESAIRNGEFVCLFAEGQITRTGLMLPFHRDVEEMMKGLGAPVIPVCVEDLWGSVFSFAGGRFLWKWPRHLRRRVSVSFGQPMPPTATAAEVRCAVQQLASDAWQRRAEGMEPLHRAFVRSARQHPFRFAMGDQRVPRMNFLSALARTIFLARRLRPHWDGQEKIGILLPPSVAGALVNFAALLMGKVPVNLNYTTSGETIASCLRQCGIRTVVSSEAFLAKVKLKLPFSPLLLEQVAEKPRAPERLAALAIACLFPIRGIERAVGCTRRVAMDDLATVIFSSGSTGDPKGVMLSHFNVAANIAQLSQPFHLTPADRLLGNLPFFHSFGFTSVLCLTATLGQGVAYHPTPLDAEAVGRLVREYSLTFLMTTPTFLQLYLNGCPADDFLTLRVVMTAAAKLPERLATAFESKFGVRPLEAYGCTECSPGVTANTLDFRSTGFRQVGAKAGSVGHPLPGIAVRIVDPITEVSLPVGTPGLLLVRGPNVMQGYLGQPEPTAQVLRDGWYVTGDIAALDEDGFIHITDRLSRFSKIGGEMVPHLKVEERLHELAGMTEPTFVVAGVPDEKKGERLVVLHRLADDVLRVCLDRLAHDALPNLWKPRRDAFIRIEVFPVLGSGKLDLRRVKEVARQSSSQPNQQ
ncbi:MAG TPA: AMP-binding protein [Verrucomicrobiota bacterium]|nr:AMP-binding protein [Verrucomicrobiota bacterium]